MYFPDLDVTKSNFYHDGRQRDHFLHDSGLYNLRVTKLPCQRLDRWYTLTNHQEMFGHQRTNQ